MGCGGRQRAAGPGTWTQNRGVPAVVSGGGKGGACVPDDHKQQWLLRKAGLQKPTWTATPGAISQKLTV